MDGAMEHGRKQRATATSLLWLRANARVKHGERCGGSSRTRPTLRLFFQPTIAHAPRNGTAGRSLQDFSALSCTAWRCWG